MFESHFRESLIIKEISRDKDKFDNNLEVQAILEVISKGKKAKLFSEVVRYYRESKNIYLFVAMLRNREQLVKILDVISKERGVDAKEQFVLGMNVFLDRIDTGERDARDFLSEELSHSDLFAFFNGPQAVRQDRVRNIHRNLNINAIKFGRALETSSFFSRRIRRMEEEKSEIKNVHILINGKRMVAIEKNEKQQRSYSFKKSAICDIEVSWNVKCTSEKDLGCVIVLGINSGQIGIKKSTIDGSNVEPKEILELAKQNRAVLIKGKALHEVLGEYLVQRIQCNENTQPCRSVIMPGYSFDEGVTIEGEVTSFQKETAVDNR